MKKFLSILTTLAMVISILAGCGTSNSNSVTSDADTKGGGSVGSASADTNANEDMAAYYDGVTIYYSTNEKAGSDADSDAIILQPYLSAYTGSTIVIQDKRGSAGVEGINYVYDRDGSKGVEIGGVVMTNFLLNYITEAAGVTYDPQGFEFIGGIGNEHYVLLVNENGKYTSIEALQAADSVIMAGTSAQGPIALSTMSCAELLDINAQVITGYSTGELILALMSGEIDAACVPAHMALSAEESIMLCSLTEERDVAISDVPSILEVCPEIADDEAKSGLLTLWDEQLIMSNIIYAAPGTPDTNLEFLRGLIDYLKTNDDYLSDISKMNQMEVTADDFISGEDLAARVSAVMDNADEIAGRLNGLITKYKI